MEYLDQNHLVNDLDGLKSLDFLLKKKKIIGFEIISNLIEFQKSLTTLQNDNNILKTREFIVWRVRVWKGILDCLADVGFLKTVISPLDWYSSNVSGGFHWCSSWCPLAHERGVSNQLPTQQINHNRTQNLRSKTTIKPIIHTTNQQIGADVGLIQLKKKQIWAYAALILLKKQYIWVDVRCILPNHMG